MEQSFNFRLRAMRKMNNFFHSYKVMGRNPNFIQIMMVHLKYSNCKSDWKLIFNDFSYQLHLYRYTHSIGLFDMATYALQYVRVLVVFFLFALSTFPKFFTLHTSPQRAPKTPMIWLEGDRFLQRCQNRSTSSFVQFKSLHISSSFIPSIVDV